MKLRIATLPLLIAAPAAIAQAQTAPAPVEGSVGIDGTVAGRCVAGDNTSGSGSFDLGVLIDTTTGFLRDNLTATPKVLTAAYCTSRSSITIAATPLQTVSSTASPPLGFSRTVNFTARASGWTPTAATFATGAGSNPAAVQTRDTAFTGDIVVSIDSFSTGGGDALRLVSDPSYLGSVTVTLAVAS